MSTVAISDKWALSDDPKYRFDMQIPEELFPLGLGHSFPCTKITINLDCGLEPHFWG